MNRKVLGKRIREERLRIGLTQEQIAEYIDVSTTYIGFVERGERSVTLEKLALLAECFHVSIDSLLREASENASDKRLFDELCFLWNAASTEDKRLIVSISNVIVNRHDP